MGKSGRIGCFSSFFNQFKRFFDKEIELIQFPEQVKELDLLVFPGGADIDPSLYGQENLCSYTSPERDRLEVKAFEIAIKSKVNMFGVCRGHQLLHALTGGELVQDLGIYLGNPHSGLHYVDGPFSKKLGKVNSLHHQGVTKPGFGESVAYHLGVIEMSVGEISSCKVISTQFHPEFLDAEHGAVILIKELLDVYQE